MKAGHWMALVLVATVLATLPAGCGVGKSSPPLRPTPTPIPLGPLPSSVRLPSGSAAPFAIYGNVLAWLGIPKPSGVCPQNEIYLANVRAYHPRIIWRGGECDVVSNVRITSRWVFWSAGASPAGSVYAWQRATGRTVRVSGQPQPPPSAEPCPAPACFPNLSFASAGSDVVWSETQFNASGDYMASSIFGKALPRGKTKLLFGEGSSCRAQTDPFLADGRLVWIQVTWPQDVVAGGETGLRQCRGAEQTNVMTATVGQVFRPGRRAGFPSPGVLITSSGLASNPQTNGRFLAWQDSFRVPASCLCSDLDVYDTRTNALLTVAHRVTDYVLSGRILAWIELRPHGERVRVGILGPRRLHVSRVRTLALAGSPGAGRFVRTFGWPSAQRLIWEVDRLSGKIDLVRVAIRDA